MSADIGAEELEEIITVIEAKYGYDFSKYARASFKRRVLRFMSISGVKTVYDMKYNFTNDRAFFALFLQTVTVNVTEMFRDPSFYKSLREKVFPQLATYPAIKIWHAGCATGEEVYSMAIMLQEEGLLSRTKIYATDINPGNLEKARKGIVSLRQLQAYTHNYIKSGGKKDFSHYYAARYEHAIINSDLKKNITFLQHNLVTDGVFNEFQLVCCRNVLIYFNSELQNQVLQLLDNSISPLGFLAVGIKETVSFSGIAQQYKAESSINKIYRRRV